MWELVICIIELSFKIYRNFSRLNYESLGDWTMNLSSPNVAQLSPILLDISALWFFFTSLIFMTRDSKLDTFFRILFSICIVVFTGLLVFVLFRFISNLMFEDSLCSSHQYLWWLSRLHTISDSETLRLYPWYACLNF